MARTIKTSISEAQEDSEEFNTGINLRPERISDFIGQDELKETIMIAIDSARVRKASLDHILFYGPPGLGKTTLANIIANEMGATKFVVTVGPNIEKPADIASLLNNLEDNSVVFIDEIHRISKIAEEMLYSAMEDEFLPIIIGTGPQQKTIKLSLPHFTLIGATTRPGLISPPLMERFGNVLKLSYYNSKELSRIAKRTSQKYGITMGMAECNYIADVSRGTPRLLNRNISKVRDYVYARNKGICDMNAVKAAMKLAGIENNGLSRMDVQMLQVLEDMGDKPIGLQSIAHILGEDSQTIEDVYEPFLLMNKYMVKTPKGRVITPKGKELLSKCKIGNERK